MKWVTREDTKTGRVACPWLIRHFTTKREKGKSFYSLGADYTHRGNMCTFEVLIEEFKLENHAITRLAGIVHGADIDGEIHTCPESSGLLAMAQGFYETTPDDHEKLRLQFPIYDALYSYCRSLTASGT